MDIPGTGSGEETTSAPLRLHQVAAVLRLPPRRIQYLRERGVVTPSSGGGGRGRPGFYTKRDVQKLRLVEGLRGLEEHLVEQILKEVNWDLDEVRFQLSPSSTIVIDLTKHRR